MAELPKSGSECVHDFYFIQSSRGLGIPQTRSNVGVCKHCGLFEVSEIVNGKFSKVEFRLTTKEAVEYAGQYRKIIGLDEEDEPLDVYNQRQRYIEQLEQIVYRCVSLTDIMREFPKAYQAIYTNIVRKNEEG